MDETATLIALTNLVAKYPDITMTTVTDVLQACNHDPTRAYNLICEMVIPPDDCPHPSTTTASATPPNPTTASVPPPSVTPPPRNPKSSPPHANRPVTFATASLSSSLSLSLSLSPPSSPSSSSPPSPSPSSSPLPFLSPSPLPLSAPRPRGAWAAANMGRRYRVDELCACYTWLSRQAADALFDKYGDCVELVEAEVLEMFPVDEPAAFAGGAGLHHSAATAAPAAPQSRVHAPTRSALQTAQHTSHPQQLPNGPAEGTAASRGANVHAESNASRVADALRERDEQELRCANRAGAAVVDRTGRTMPQLRVELWEKRKELTRANALASQTRQARRISEAHKVSDELSKLSAYLLERIRASHEYREGYIDLHGLTKDEAIELVRGKLDGDGGGGKRRFRVITGKGIHSQNGQAVLRPALERYLQRRGVKYSQYGDGIITVIP